MAFLVKRMSGYSIISNDTGKGIAFVLPVDKVVGGSGLSLVARDCDLAGAQARIEQLGDLTGIIVESTVYRDSGGVVWAAGRGRMATPIP